MKRLRILLAEDHVITAEGLQSILEDDFDLVSTVEDGRAMIEMAKKLSPDLIIADISMPLLNGLEALRQLRREGVSAKVVFLTMHAEVPLTREAFRAGASGYLLKQSASKELIAAVHEVSKGGRYITPLITDDPVNFFTDVDRQVEASKINLTPRQREVLQLLAEGRAMKEIAFLLKISVRTVESHKYDMMEALGVETNAGLVKYAVQIGLVRVTHAAAGDL